MSNAASEKERIALSARRRPLSNSTAHILFCIAKRERGPLQFHHPAARRCMLHTISLSGAHGVCVCVKREHSLDTLWLSLHFHLVYSCSGYRVFRTLLSTLDWLFRIYIALTNKILRWDARGLSECPASSLEKSYLVVNGSHQNTKNQKPYSIVDCLFERNQPVCSASIS